MNSQKSVINCGLSGERRRRKSLERKKNIEKKEIKSENVARHDNNNCSLLPRATP